MLLATATQETMAHAIVFFMVLGTAMAASLDDSVAATSLSWISQVVRRQGEGEETGGGAHHHTGSEPESETGGINMYYVLGGIIILLVILGGLAAIFRRQLLKMFRKKRTRYQRVPMEETT